MFFWAEDKVTKFTLEARPLTSPQGTTISANLHCLIVPRYQRCTLGRRAFFVGVRPSGIHCLSNCVNRLWATVSFGAH